jgi:hypothetical protein
MEEKVTKLMIPLIRPDGWRSPTAADIEPTPLEIQRWEDDGGAVPPVPARSARCHWGADYRRRAAA